MIHYMPTKQHTVLPYKLVSYCCSLHVLSFGHMPSSVSDKGRLSLIRGKLFPDRYLPVDFNCVVSRVGCLGVIISV